VSAIGSWFSRVRAAFDQDGTLRRVIKNTGWLSGSTGIVMGLAVLQGALTGRLLGVTLWGVLGVALSFASVVSKLLSFRMQEFVVQWVTQLQDDSTRAATAFRLAILADVATATLAFLIVELLAWWGAAAFAKSWGYAWVFQIIGLTALFRAGRESFEGMLHVNRDFHINGVILVIGQAAAVVGVVVVWFAGWGLLGVTVAIVAAQALQAILLWGAGLRAARIVLRPGWATSHMAKMGDARREMLSFAGWTNVSGTLSILMNEGDLLVIGLLVGPTQAAFYKLAQSIARIAPTPVTLLAKAAYPEFSETAGRQGWEDFRRLMRRGSKAAAVWMITMSVALVVASPFAIALLYGKPFLPAVPAVAILLVGFCVDGSLFWTRSALLALGEPGYLTRVNLWMTVAQFGLAFLLVPYGGYLTMATVTTSAIIGMNVLGARRTFKVLRLREAVAHG
jgi:O-antigen/teichoic acid export membrane protein